MSLEEENSALTPKNSDERRVEKTVAPCLETGKEVNQRPKYLVRWKGYPPSGDTWQTEDSLRDGSSELVDEYEAKIRSIRDMQARIRKGQL